MDPVEIRQKNFIGADEFPYTNNFGLDLRLGQLQGDAGQGAELRRLRRVPPASRPRRASRAAISASASRPGSRSAASAPARRRRQPPAASRSSNRRRSASTRPARRSLRRHARPRAGSRDDLRADRRRHARSAHTSRSRSATATPPRVPPSATARTAAAAWRSAVWPCASRAKRSSTRRRKIAAHLLEASRGRHRLRPGPLPRQGQPRQREDDGRSRLCGVRRQPAGGVDHGLEAIVVLRSAELRLAVRRPRVRASRSIPRPAASTCRSTSPSTTAAT